MHAKVRKFVVAVDMGSSGDHAIRAGLDQLATVVGSVMHVIHVVDPREVVDYPEKAALETEEELIAALPKVLSARVRAVADETRRAAPMERVHTHVRLGRAVETIRQVCVDYDADLLIVGTHGRRGIDRLLLGSVAEELVRTANCPVLVTRATNYEGLVRTALPDAPYRAGEVPGQFLAATTEHVTSTQMDGWIASDTAPTGFRIV